MPEVNKSTDETQIDLKKSRDYVWFKKEFSASTLLFWIKGSISVDYRFVRIVEQNTVLGIIPAGSHKQNIPLKNISDASIETAYSIKRFILGAILAIIGFNLFAYGAFIALIVMLIGAGIFLNGVLTKLSIEKSGSDYVIEVPFYDKTNIVAAQKAIEQALITDTDKTDQSLYHHRLADDDLDDVQ